MSMDDTCDCCGEMLSANIRLNSEFHFGNGSQFTDHWDLCNECAEDVVNYLKKVKTKLKQKG